MTPTPAMELIERFTAACRSDDRIVAAFLGGSLATGTADEHSDIDIYLITRTDAYQSFFDDRHDLIRRLGTPVFAEDFSEFGFDMVLFIYDSGAYGELAMAPQSNFLTIHGGPYRVLLDKAGVLDGTVFPYFAPAEDDRRRAVARALTWFWRELLYAAIALERGRLWTTASYVETLRRHVKTLLEHHYHRSIPPAAWRPLESTVSDEDRTAIAATYGPLDPSDLARVLRALVAAYRRAAPAAAADYELPYPHALEDVVMRSQQTRILKEGHA